MKASTRIDPLLEQRLALGAYLEALLTGDVTGTVAPASEQEPAPADDPPVTVAQPPSQPRAPADVLPEWAQARFQVLLFEVAGLTLAVPLVKLKGVVPNVNGLTGMPGHSALFLGVTPYQGVQSKVVDTARFVLPRDRAARLGDDAAERSAHLVVIDEGRWALACSKIGDVIELESDQVKWRTAAGKRRWLAGTVIEQMCAMLDIDELVRQLADGMA